MSYFSVSLVLICIVDDAPDADDEYLQDLQVFLVEARDFEDAFSQALKLGAAAERRDQNSDGQTVAWRFKEVAGIRNLGSHLLDREVASRMERVEIPAGEFTTDLDPAATEPSVDDDSEDPDGRAIQSTAAGGTVTALLFRRGHLTERIAVSADQNLVHYEEMFDDRMKSFDMTEQYEELVSSDAQANVRDYRLYASFVKWDNVQEDERIFTVVLLRG